MKSVSKSKLKSKMLAYFREIEKTGKPLIVTNRDKPVLKIVPISEQSTFEEVFADYQNKMTYSEPLDAPTTEEWDEV